MSAVAYPSLEHVAQQARPYPSRVLAGAETGLCLFAAAFLGHNDAVHFAEAGVDTTCVDVDYDRLEEMRALYPDDWEFLCADAFEFAYDERKMGRRWDVVSLDPFTGNAMNRASQAVQLWCDLANRAVVLGAWTPTLGVKAPDGWEITGRERRANDVYWIVMERA